jgi:hypothetical protein
MDGQLENIQTQIIHHKIILTIKPIIQNNYLIIKLFRK